MKYTIVILVTFLLLSACNSTEQRPITCNLYMRYEQDGRKMKAEATFFMENPNGENTRTRMEGGVAFLGSTMTFSKKLVRYQSERTIDLPEHLSFSWNSPGGAKTSFGMDPVKIGNFKLTPTAVGFLLNIGAPILDKNEKLTLLFDSPEHGRSNLELDGPTDETGIEIAGSEVSKFKQERVSMSLVRTKTYYEEQGNCTCTVTQSFYSDWKEIEF